MNFLKSIGWETHLKPFLYKKLPQKTGWSAVLGTLCAVAFIIMTITGMILAFYYVPSPDKAWDSVQFITNEVPFGSLVRGLHHWGAGTMVLLVFCHLMINYLNGSFMAPRQITWVTGAFLFFVVLGLGFTGYLLPWDMKAYWATIVGANIPNSYPGIGNFITRFILGGDGMSGFTLSRFYAVHTLILPACLLIFMAMHIYLIRVHNLSDPRERVAGEKLPEETGKPYRFFPEHMNRSSIAMAILLVGLFSLAYFVPVHMEDKAGTFIADYLPRPEWYYMWLFQLLTYFSGTWDMIGSLVIPIGGALLVLFVPFISESRMKGIINRPISLAIGTTFIVCVTFLTVMAYQEAKPYNKTIVIPSGTLTTEQKAGLKIFVERECAYCHNILGKGGHRTGPDLSNVVRKHRTAKYLANYIEKPTSVFPSSTMPAYALKPEELNNLAAFILSLDFKKNGQPIEVSTEELRKSWK
ncbi:cytochrome b N-terminal domain-containing protein [Desulfovibrio litoralis]|uniref:Ubiquinol-cytochrome c reductase cytochrome b subunit n=1 Tax=Desulfovibrio litoralis DSM 11393 TaxID=1121455 RepID=A0A1M7SPG8_9BACT|nr:cytochrome b N-terminal domain-containing protein [Desulfovibrio litoralis]SHN60355.1 ubiquinol-cytochrome c reductase cytochrome b subunit [Desulfovibrio litoralis DSM 11393]